LADNLDLSDFSYAQAYDTSTYQQAKLANLQFIETNLVKAATNYTMINVLQVQHLQKNNQSGFLYRMLVHSGKEDGRFQREIPPITMMITDGVRSKTVHVNHLRHRVQLQPDEMNGTTSQPATTSWPWSPLQTEYSVSAAEPSERRYPKRERRPPDRWTY